MATGVTGVVGTVGVVEVVVAVAKGVFCICTIFALVFGPTTPQPVEPGVPEDTIFCSFCHCFTAASVSGPKYPVM
jgi:hypothetical protein